MHWNSDIENAHPVGVIPVKLSFPQPVVERQQNWIGFMNEILHESVFRAVIVCVGCIYQLKDNISISYKQYSQIRYVCLYVIVYDAHYMYVNMYRRVHAVVVITVHLNFSGF